MISSSTDAASRKTAWLGVASWLLLIVQVLGTLVLLPSHLAEEGLSPPVLGTIGALLVPAWMLVRRMRGRPGALLERRVLSLFLAGMPVVYLVSYARAPQPGWLSIELVGLVIYSLLALASLRASPYLLAIGIAGHGVGWDVWHLGRTNFVPDWYAAGCLVVDLALALYVAIEVGLERREGRHVVTART